MGSRQVEKPPVCRRQKRLYDPLWWLAVAALLRPVIVVAEAPVVERITWQKAPIGLALSVGQERLVHFPADVRVGVPESLQNFLRVQAVNGTVYLLARGAFDAKRMMVHETASGAVYLLDVEASREGGSEQPVRIVREENGNEGSKPDAGGSDTAQEPGPSQYGYVALIRFAAQQIYAPARLLRALPGVVRTPVRREDVPLVRGGAVVATPLVVWRAPGLYLTAVKLTNLTNAPHTLDPRDLRGQWLAASFQHNRLLAAGDAADTTAVYLISARPFAASL